MIDHIVLFKWKEDASATAIAKAIEALKGLQGKVPGIVDLSCGENFSDRAKGFHHGLVVRFNTRDELAAYMPHPVHQEVVQNLIKPILQDILSVDYEF